MDTRLKSAYILSIVIAVLALVASAGGLFIGNLYRDSSAFIMAGWFGNDLVTLSVALPLLVGALVLSMKGSHRAQLVWFGILDYMLYNYAFYVFGAAFNRFFLIYVALFTLSIFALIFGLAKIDVDQIGHKFQAKTPLKWVSGYMMLWATLLGAAWITQALIFAVTGHLPPSGLGEGGIKLVAALDLSFVVSGLVLAAIWLWKRRPWGYVLSVIFNVKGAVYTLVLTAGSLSQARAGLEGAMDLVPLWVFLGLGSLVSSVLLLRNMQS
ncbi:MAG: hypothetical protein HPY71_14780 [Firmicutes bacterium]|nr:hypothetical protein [Bacillota bacterium]